MKYPKSMHFQFSPGLQNDDRVSQHAHLWNPEMEIVVSEKLDGESCSMLSHKIHARSEDSLHHESRNYAKMKWGYLRYMIPEHIQIVCENVYAKYSIFYPELTDFLYIINIFDIAKNIVLSWDDMEIWSIELQIPLAPIIFRGKVGDWIPTLPEKSKFGPEIEGYVTRNADEFPIDEFHIHLAKYVRKGHVQTKEHWKRTWIPNKLKEN